MTTPSLPNYVTVTKAGFTIQPESQVIRSDMESGPPKQVRRFSRSMIKRPVLLYLDSKSDFNSFVTWVNDTLAGGSLWFNWSDPVSGAIKLTRIVDGVYEARPDAAMTQWEISTVFETWS